MAWYNSINEAKAKGSEMTGISNPGDVLDPLGRTKDAISDTSKGVDVMFGTQGGMDTSGRGNVETMKNAEGEDFDFSDPNEKTAAQVANEKGAAELERIKAEREATRAQQSAQINTLQRAARGGGPSAAQDQLQLASQRNMRAALSMAASGRGNPALASQSAGNQRAIIGQQQASQSGALRAHSESGRVDCPSQFQRPGAATRTGCARPYDGGPGVLPRGNSQQFSEDCSPPSNSRRNSWQGRAAVSEREELSHRSWNLPNEMSVSPLPVREYALALL